MPCQKDNYLVFVNSSQNYIRKEWGEVKGSYWFVFVRFLLEVLCIDEWDSRDDFDGCLALHGGVAHSYDEVVFVSFSSSGCFGDDGDFGKGLAIHANSTCRMSPSLSSIPRLSRREFEPACLVLFEK